MKKLIVILTVCLMAAVATSIVRAEEKTDLHLIVFAQDADTEIEVRAGDGKRQKEIVDAGVTYLTYKADKAKLTVWEYGEATHPRVDKGRDGDLYSIVTIRPPGESVGEE